VHRLRGAIAKVDLLVTPVTLGCKPMRYKASKRDHLPVTPGHSMVTLAGKTLVPQGVEA
jgi:hypothetical protein